VIARAMPTSVRVTSPVLISTPVVASVECPVAEYSSVSPEIVPVAAVLVDPTYQGFGSELGALVELLHGCGAGLPVLVEVGSRCHGGDGLWLDLEDECWGYNQAQ
jgi:hypothetical protein